MIPYNPSSFNTNKTILEQILELKNWLKDHPSYEIFYSSESGNTLAYTGYSLSAISDSTNLEVGDVVIFSNVMAGVVISVDRDNGTYGCDACVSFKGDTGATGQQGYSLRVSSENYVDDVTAYHRNSLEPSHGTRENDTILFANGYVGIVTSLGAGATYYVTNRTVSFVGPQGPQGPQGPTGATGPQGPTGPTGADGNDGVSITNVAIDGNSHLIVTLSDGSSIDAGSVSSGGHIVTLTSTSGTLSQSDYDIINNNADSVIDFSFGGTHTYFVKHLDNGTYIYLYNFNSTNFNEYFSITKSTRAYTTSKVGLKSSGINSQTATNGQVLTADGNGGASWKNAGSGKYLINVTLAYGTSDYKRMRIFFQIVHNSSSFTDINEIVTILNDQGYNDNTHYITAVGSIETGTNTNIFNNICGCASISGSLYAKITHNDQAPTNEIITAPLSSINVYQNSIQL